MNKKFITALIIAFIAVKNPVNLVAAEMAYAAASETFEKANAISEVNIADNIENLYSKQNITIEEKAKIELIAYQTALNEERAKIKAAEEARIQTEYANGIAKLQSAGLTATYINNYVSAEKRYGVPWQVIAAVHYTETHQSGNTAVTSYAGAQGPMQFMPSTFKAYAQDGNGDGVSLIGNVDDAIYTGANYLAANGAASGNVVAGLYRYNHDYGYVYHVLSIARTIGYSK